MNILMTYPETPTTFYCFRNALKFISKKSTEPPLGLLKVAAMFPKTWQVKLIDMNVENLKDKHYFERIIVSLKEYDLLRNSSKKVNFRDVKAFLKSIWKLGFLEKGRKYYWKLLFSTLRDYPQKFSLAKTLSIYEYHFRKVV
jgi:uncharacterized protein DUF4070